MEIAIEKAFGNNFEWNGKLVANFVSLWVDELPRKVGGLNVLANSVLLQPPFLAFSNAFH